MLPILYQDEHLVAIHKPPALLVHRTGLDAGETRFALQLLRDQLGRPVWPVHRLDKGTSGALLFALSAPVAQALGAQWQAEGGVAKQYLAVVRGWPQNAAGLIDHPLKRMADGLPQGPGGAAWQAARTHWRTLAHYAAPLPYGPFAHTRCALLALQPQTGRRHQLRRHCKHMAHPIIGDATHGKGPLNRALAAALGLQRLWLHAQALSLAHPVTGQRLHIQAPPRDEWQRWSPWRCASPADDSPPPWPRT